MAKKYTIQITKMIKHFDTIEVKASCPVEAKRIARFVAMAQERAEALGDTPKKIEFEGKEYSKFGWSELESTVYRTEIV